MAADNNFAECRLIDLSSRMKTDIHVDLAQGRVSTSRLRLAPATVAALEAELRHDHAALTELLSAEIPSGVVEIGYGIVGEFQRRGYATEAAAGLVGWAHAHPEVRMVAAHTLPELTASIRVLEKNGFVRRGIPAEEGAIRFEMDLPASFA